MKQDHDAGHSIGQGRQRKFTEGLLDVPLILRELNLSPGQTVVDAGCGTGYMSRLFLEQVGDSGRVYAVDINERFIEQLQKELAVPNVWAMVCSMADQTLIPGESVDLVYISTVMHAQRPTLVQGIVRELQRILRPGGLLAVVEIHKHETPFGPPLKQRYSPEELQRVFPFAPLKTVSVAEHFYMQVFRKSGS